MAPPYDIEAEGLVVWPGDSFATEAVFDLHTGRVLALRPGPDRAAVPAAVGDGLLLGGHPIPWRRWVATWERDRLGEPPLRPYLEGVRILPPEPDG